MRLNEFTTSWELSLTPIVPQSKANLPVCALARGGVNGFGAARSSRRSATRRGPNSRTRTRPALPHQLMGCRRRVRPLPCHWQGWRERPTRCPASRVLQFLPAPRPRAPHAARGRAGGPTARGRLRPPAPRRALTDGRVAAPRGPGRGGGASHGRCRSAPAGVTTGGPRDRLLRPPPPAGCAACRRRRHTDADARGVGAVGRHAGRACWQPRAAPRRAAPVLRAVGLARQHPAPRSCPPARARSRPLRPPAAAAAVAAAGCCARSAVPPSPPPSPSSPRHPST